MMSRLQNVFGIARQQSDIIIEETDRITERAVSIMRNLRNIPNEELQLPTRRQLEEYDEEFEYSPPISPSPSETTFIQAAEASILEEGVAPQHLNIVLEEPVTSDEEDEAGAGDDEDEHGSGCKCTNCSQVIATFSECLICRYPLQGRGVHDCSHCDKVWCTKCSVRLIHCPFCRRTLWNPLKANRNLTSLVDSILLPCKFKGSGCQKLLSLRTRKRHERHCQFIDAFQT